MQGCLIFSYDIEVQTVMDKASPFENFLVNAFI